MKENKDEFDWQQYLISDITIKYIFDMNLKTFQYYNNIVILNLLAIIFRVYKGRSGLHPISSSSSN